LLRRVKEAKQRLIAPYEEAAFAQDTLLKANVNTKLVQIPNRVLHVQRVGANTLSERVLQAQQGGAAVDLQAPQQTRLPAVSAALPSDGELVNSRNQPQTANQESIIRQPERGIGTDVSSSSAHQDKKIEIVVDEAARMARRQAIVTGVELVQTTPEGVATGPAVVSASDQRHTIPLLSAAVVEEGRDADGGENEVWNGISRIGELPRGALLFEALKIESVIIPVKRGISGQKARKSDWDLAFSKTTQQESVNKAA
jgi:hypothetical protein